MNKEELKQEAEEYFKSICGDYNEEYERTGKRHYWVGFDIKNAYLVSAEPREKRIVELEQKLEQIKNERFEKALSQIKHDREVVIEYNERLKQENAELRKLKRECETSLCRAEYQYNYEQLTKAKKLLKKWVELYKPKLEGYPITPIQEETENFLKDSEVE